MSSNTVRLAVGQLVGGRYRIEHELGEGGMGVVYLAADEQVPGERFAIKVLKEGLRPEALALLREEVRKTRKLSHPNIVDVHSVNVDGERLYVLMEYLEGKSLDALLAEEFGRGMSFSHAWPIIEDVGAALANAHDHNVIHSDLKPANVFLTTSGKTKLLDFGVARVSRGLLLHAPPGSRALTATYASCEMLEGREADRRDDIYSFACVIYEMLCGERPFGDLTALEARDDAAQMPPLQGLSREQNAALAQALAFDREARTGTVETLLAGLAAGHLPPRSRPAALVAVAVIALVAAVGLTSFALERLSVSRHSVVVEGVTSGAQQAAVSPKSIAVLPLLDLSTGHEQQYFADGLTAALIDRLTLFPGLSVTGQTSSFAVKESRDDAPTLARRLRVAYLLEGTVRGSAEQLRVSTRLLRGADGFQLWSQVFDRSGGEILKLEEDIARAVAVDLQSGLVDLPPALSSTHSLEAYRLLLQADHLWRQEPATDAERALIEAALQKDPGYVKAWVELGSWWYDAMLFGRVAPDTAVPRARAAYDRALVLDENSSRANIGLAWLQMSQLDWAGAERSIARAESLDPANLLVLTARGELARSAGHWAEAIRLEQERVPRDPLSAGAKFILAQSHLCGGEYADAEEIAGQAIAENPRYPGAHALLARAFVARGDAAHALEVIALEPDESARLAGLASAQYALGRRQASEEAATQLRTRYGHTLPGLAGLAYAYRNELEPAFQWLQRAVEQRQPEFAASLACTPEPAFSPLHADPRFAALRSSLGFNQ